MQVRNPSTSLEIADAVNAAAQEWSAYAGRLGSFSRLYILQADKLEEHLGPEALLYSPKAIRKYPPDVDQMLARHASWDVTLTTD